MAAGSAMEQPLWLLVPWAVFALALGFKFWRITALVRQHLLAGPSGTEQVRQQLERIWLKDPASAGERGWRNERTT